MLYTCAAARTHVDMSDFEALHPRAAAGRFTSKTNDAPDGTLSGATLPNGRTPAPGMVGIHGEKFFQAADIDPHQRWNGFAVPSFTREVTEQIVQWTNDAAGPDEPSFEWDGDTLIDVWRDGDEEDRQEVGQTVLSDGTVLYDVGAFSWVWSEPDE